MGISVVIHNNVRKKMKRRQSPDNAIASSKNIPQAVVFVLSYPIDFKVFKKIRGRILSFKGTGFDREASGILSECKIIDTNRLIVQKYRFEYAQRLLIMIKSTGFSCFDRCRCREIKVNQ
jgi:hypothetical protein